MDEKKCVLRVRGLEKSFDGESILRGIDLDVYQGDVISVIGPSGSGKSTLIRCIDFLEEPDKGSVILDGTDYANMSAPLKQLHERVGMVFQSFNLFANHTVLENCTLPLITVKRLDRKTAKAIALENLEKVGMAAFQHRGRSGTLRWTEAAGGDCPGAVHGTPADAVRRTYQCIGPGNGGRGAGGSQILGAKGNNHDYRFS